MTAEASSKQRSTPPPRRQHVDDARTLALAQLAIEQYTALRIGLEGTYSAGLQLLFGAAAIQIGILVYLFYPNVPRTGYIISFLVLQPTVAIIAITAVGGILWPREQHSIAESAIADFPALLDGPADASDEMLSQLSLTVNDARVVLSKRESGLRWAVTLAIAWLIGSFVAVELLLRLAPDVIDSVIGYYIRFGHT